MSETDNVPEDTEQPTADVVASGGDAPDAASTDTKPISDAAVPESSDSKSEPESAVAEESPEEKPEPAAENPEPEEEAEPKPAKPKRTGPLEEIVEAEETIEMDLSLIHI